MYYGAYKRKTPKKSGLQISNLIIFRFIVVGKIDRNCNSCPDKIEDEPHFLVECSTVIKIKTDFLELVSTEFPNFRTLSDKNQKYNFIMKIHDENLLKRLAFSH